MLQQVVVALLVCAAAGYAVWTLVPPVRRWFGAGAKAGACGGCDGCGSAPVPKPGAEQPIRIVRRGRPPQA